MKKRTTLLTLVMLVISITCLFADPSSVNPEDQPAGEPVRIEILVVLALVAFALFKLFGVGNKKAPPPPPKPKPKSLLKQVNEAIGGMQEIGDKTYVGGKLVASKKDVETYLMMAQVDRSHIRKQERAMAEEAYQNYERKIFYLRVAVGLFIIFILAITHETLIEWWNVSSTYLKELFASSPSSN